MTWHKGEWGSAPKPVRRACDRAFDRDLKGIERRHGHQQVWRDTPESALRYQGNVAGEVPREAFT
jgi:hypothetical protein